MVSSCLKCCSDNVNLIIKEANSKESKDRLRRQTDEAYKRGIFGAPSFFACNALFWGNDRLEKAIKYATNNSGLTNNPGDAYGAPDLGIMPKNR